jgi:hypothetical protein
MYTKLLGIISVGSDVEIVAKYNYTDPVKEDEMGRAYSTHVGEQERI